MRGCAIGPSSFQRDEPGCCVPKLHKSLPRLAPSTRETYGDVAVVTARGQNTGHFRGKRISADEWVTDVYRKVDGRWLCVLTHLTPVAAR